MILARGLLRRQIYFFTVFTIESCYIWRVVRLGVSFAPRIKRAIPWVMSVSEHKQQQACKEGGGGGVLVLDRGGTKCST